MSLETFGINFGIYASDRIAPSRINLELDLGVTLDWLS